MKKITVLELVLIIVAIIFGIRWILNPDGQFEPVIAFCALLISGIDIWRRYHHHESNPPNMEPDNTPKQEENRSPVNHNNGERLPPFKFSSSCAFFAQRFAQAFPGIRQGQWFEGTQAVERLKILLDHPLCFSRPDNRWITPIGWQRNGNMTIDDFRVIDKSTIIIDHQEIKVKRIYAGFMPNYKQLFVYLEAEEMPAIGLYEHTPDSFKETLNNFGYVWEEYGLYNGIHPVTREEYDDDAAIIMGKPVNLEGNCELRARYLSPYNMIISASLSPLNKSSFDETLKSYMDRMLQGENCMDEFVNEVKKLPSVSG